MTDLTMVVGYCYIHSQNIFHGNILCPSFVPLSFTSFSLDLNLFFLSLLWDRDWWQSRDLRHCKSSRNLMLMSMNLVVIWFLLSRYMHWGPPPIHCTPHLHSWNSWVCFSLELDFAYLWRAVQKVRTLPQCIKYKLFITVRLKLWVVIVSCQALKPTVLIGTSGRGGTFTKEALEEIASYQDVCTPSSSPLPPSLNKPKTVPNLFWICAPEFLNT